MSKQRELAASARRAADQARATGTAAGQSTGSFFDRVAAAHERFASEEKKHVHYYRSDVSEWWCEDTNQPTDYCDETAAD